jgi:hypothetical protein
MMSIAGHALSIFAGHDRVAVDHRPEAVERLERSRQRISAQLLLLQVLEQRWPVLRLQYVANPVPWVPLSRAFSALARSGVRNSNR